ncbi:uncharacterized protein BO96DRAFT_329546 [Aspergillus niger CBS 101883]|uniref:uncharacterized protein n=1 Tax=Aspergillus lacticoffeatus (strain CBS 101883) TaxID=1450533 RepID=UPI000D7F9CE1|nr:uncharacterized protein BO96DRAFT_329546 [Aspergillus niger CBS 101883]PYH59924.1 hypothetical protein BO96DRAFT_329546 [Aspergillus niger CBS 101883]
MSVVPIETDEVSNFCTRSYFLGCDSIFLRDVLHMARVVESAMTNRSHLLDVCIPELLIRRNPAYPYYWCKSRRSTAASIRSGSFVLMKSMFFDACNEMFIAFATARPEKFKIYRFSLSDPISPTAAFDALLGFDPLNY